MYPHLNTKRLNIIASRIIWLLFAAVLCSSEANHDNLQFWISKPKLSARRAMSINSSYYYSRFRYVKDTKFVRNAETNKGSSGYNNNSLTMRATDEKKVHTRDANVTDNQTNIVLKLGMKEDEFSYGINPYELAKQFKMLLSQFAYAEVDVEVLGRTASYNDILLFKISDKQLQTKPSLRANDDKFEQDPPQKKIIFIVHALSTMGLSKLLSLTDERYLQNLLSHYIIHLDRFDIYLMPLANPDGFLQSKTAPYWNKNYSPQTLCAGVALDRNFDVAWNSFHGITSCSQRYPGPYPFSEPESSAVRDVFKRYNHKMVAYFHVHSGTYDSDVFKGDAVLYPKGYSDSYSLYEDKYIDLKAEIDETIKNANFKQLSVTVDSLYNWYGQVSGSSVDYASTVYGIPYAMELVMQIYEGPVEINPFQKRNLYSELDFHALKEVWSRVLEVIFTSLKKVYLEQA